MAITLRSVKGSALTHAELDANFTTLRDVASQTSGNIDNVTVGATTRSPGKFTTFDANGAVNLGQTTGISIIQNSQTVTLDTVLHGRNRFINGSVAIDSRNKGVAQTFTAAAAIAYSVDRWYGSCTGANVTGQRIAGTAPNQYVYRFTGAASVTSILFGQRIEAANIFDLVSTTATFSVKLANSVLTSVTWTAYYANSTDTFSAKTQIATGTFTITSTLTRYSIQIALGANAGNGIAIELSVGAQTSGTWTIGELQLEKGTIATDFEHIDYGKNLAFCQRYYMRYGGAATSEHFMLGMGYTSTLAYFVATLPVTMRAIPTISSSTLQLTDQVSTFTVSSPTIAANEAGLNTVGFYVTSSGLTVFRPVFLRTNASLDAYLAFEAEL